jgi:acyl-CoA oxidase
MLLQLWFNNVRVSRDAMLDAFSSVDDEGVFRSKIPSVSQRFGTMVGGLTTGKHRKWQKT